MSGPVEPRDETCENALMNRVEVREGRATRIGHVDIMRVLPTKGRRTVGPWCFVDLILPGDADDPDPMEIGPHPHIGLATVTWLFSGAAEHSDSLGSQQLIRPGELNLMSAGAGIAHAEQGLGPHLRGVQMWVAQPEATRHGGSGFEHHGQLPEVDLGNGRATVILGKLAEVVSPARTDWATVGAELDIRRGETCLPVAADHEHAIVPIDQPVRVGEAIVEPGWLALVPAGLEELRLDVRSDAATVMLIGGEPLGARIEMWWNFVARSKDEITTAWRDWQTGDTDRFGPVPSTLARIEAPPPPWLPPGEVP